VPSLDELKKKWFLDFSSSVAGFPPIRRHEGSAVSTSTDDNLVTPLIDGQDYMAVWHDQVAAMTAGDELYHAGWRFEGINTLGESTPSSNALDTVNAADSAGAKMYVMTDRSVATYIYNLPTVLWLRSKLIWTAALDNRFPPLGSQHQKFACLKRAAEPSAVVGSIDISKTRWDRPTHAPVDKERNPRFGKPTHDTGVRIQGPAVADVELTFTERWNDSTRSFGLEPLAPPLPLITTPVTPPAKRGTHSVQALHTYGRTKKLFGYSWSPVGEFTVWAAYLNALLNATTYIYIEDQYFLAFDWPPCHTRPAGIARDSDIVYQLGEAIRRGVKVAVLVPSNAEDPVHAYQKYQRDIAANYLATVASRAPGEFVIASPHNGTGWIYVHSKLLIVDDEFVLIGSANVGQRSMSCDAELSVGIVDATGTFAQEFRKSLWGEHLVRSAGTLDDPNAAYALFKSDTLASSGRVRPYPTGAPGSPPAGHDKAMVMIVDPYYGPPR
jgi:phosphatidylserine/phosphatidylglycerophosphate/cardiolipin synthase-like enzyme